VVTELVKEWLDFGTEEQRMKEETAEDDPVQLWTKSEDLEQV
jgi:polyphosphate kinase 2 (PPK2 family)